MGFEDWIMEVDALQAEHFWRHEREFDEVDDFLRRLDGRLSVLEARVGEVNDLLVEDRDWTRDSVNDIWLTIEDVGDALALVPGTGVERIEVPESVERGGAVGARRVHYPEDAGSIPAPATFSVSPSVRNPRDLAHLSLWVIAVYGGGASGEWSAHSTWFTKGLADQEIEYLTESSPRESFCLVAPTEKLDD